LVEGRVKLSQKSVAKFNWMWHNIGEGKRKLFLENQKLFGAIAPIPKTFQEVGVQ